MLGVCVGVGVGFGVGRGRRRGRARGRGWRLSFFFVNFDVVTVRKVSLLFVGQ